MEPRQKLAEINGAEESTASTRDEKGQAVAVGEERELSAATRFSHANIFTPTGNKLVHDLSFEVGKSDSLLLTGHNGAGKSSLFRCLAGLWKIPEGGVIEKPGWSGDDMNLQKERQVSGSTGLASTVFYLPQKPYNVLGTLIDQLTYPEIGATKSTVSMERVRT